MLLRPDAVPGLAGKMCGCRALVPPVEESVSPIRLDFSTKPTRVRKAWYFFNRGELDLLFKAVSCYQSIALILLVVFAGGDETSVRTCPVD